MLNQVFSMFFGNTAADASTGPAEQKRATASLTRKNLASVQEDRFAHSSDASPAASADEQHARKKRGRPPKLQQPTGTVTRSKQLKIDVGSSSHDSDSSDGGPSGAQKRRRGERDAASIPHTPSSMLSERSISMRRSQRGRHIDTNKELIVLLPDTDPRAVLEIRGDAEWDLFQQALNEDNSGDWSDGDDHHAHHGVSHKQGKQRKVGFSAPLLKTEVYTPKVAEATETSQYLQAISIDVHTPRTESSGLKKFAGVVNKSKFNYDAVNCSNELKELVGQLHESRLRGGYSNVEAFDTQTHDDTYLSYDASSDDESSIEELLDEISSTSSKKVSRGGEDHKTSLRRFVNNRILEMMFARLEKELESVKSFTRVQNDTVRSYNYIQTLVQASQHLVKWSQQYCFSSNTSSISQMIDLDEKLQSNLTKQALKAKQESKEDYSDVKAEDGMPDPRSNMTCSFEELAYFKVEDLQKFVPEDHAMHILSMVLDEYLKPVSKGNAGENAAKKGSSHARSISEKEHNVSHDITPALKQRICREMYFHWIYKRSEYKQSFLRAYHRFMMHLWHQPEKVTVPMHIDYDPSSLLTSYKQLQQIRKDLDRARLIVDRVRRREKLKKDVVRCSSEQMGLDVFGISKTSIPNSASTSSLASIAQNPVLLSARKRGRPKLESPYSAQDAKSIGSLTPKMAQGRDRFGEFLKKTGQSHSTANSSSANQQSNTENVPIKATHTPSHAPRSDLWKSIDPTRLIPEEEIIFSVISDDSGFESDDSEASFSATSSSTVAQLLTMTTPNASGKHENATMDDPPSTETNIDKADVKQITSTLSESVDEDDKPPAAGYSKDVQNSVKSKTRSGAKANTVSAQASTQEHKTPIKSKYMLTGDELKSQQLAAAAEELPPSASRHRVVPGEQLADSLKTPRSQATTKTTTSSIDSASNPNSSMSVRRSSRTSVPECSLQSIACSSTGSARANRKR